MANSITFELTDSQMKSFEQLLDEFNLTMKRIEANQPARQEQMAKLGAEIRLVLDQAHEDFQKIREINERQPKMIWEQ